MAAPEYVPLPVTERARTGEPMPPPRPWTPTRPGDLPGRQPTGRHLGRPGPDQGYALALAHRFVDRLTLAVGEDTDDVIAGCLVVALRRASLFGRAPVVYDLELAFTLFGFLGSASDDLVAFRRPLFAGASHHYWDQRKIADLVPESTLRKSPVELRARLQDWRSQVTEA